MCLLWEEQDDVAAIGARDPPKGADAQLADIVVIDAIEINIAIGPGDDSKVHAGDATIGASTNVGAGTITCNYDGVFKHRTEIGEDVFIGSNTLLVAPVSVGDGAMTATGTVVTRDVPAGDMAVARTKQENKAGFATRFMTKLRAAKARKAKE